MKKIIALAVIISFSGLIFATTANTFGKHIHKISNDDKSKEVGIKFFQGTWAEALTAAETDNKIIFLDAYAAWCGPCKLMTANTFTDEKVGHYFNENFISFKMDMEKNADGPRLSSKYALKAYPTLFFVNSKEEIVHQTLGYHEPAQLLAVGEVVMAK